MLTLQGSFAAFIQSWIGNVLRYGVFAFLQSAGMNGCGFAWTMNMARVGVALLLRKWLPVEATIAFFELVI